MNIDAGARHARNASRIILSQDAQIRRSALRAVRHALDKRRDEIFYANQSDLRRSESEKLATPLIKRLKFDSSKIDQVNASIAVLEETPDPIGQTLEKRQLDTDLVLERRTVPIGVVGMIFESRPDALIQIAALCMRSGNAVILKGGSEAKETNQILGKIIAEASIAAGMPEGWIYLAESREDVQSMLTLEKYINLLIPRGSKEFVTHIMKNSSIPVLGHADGICHVYLDKTATLEKALPIVVDSKMQYVAACNAAETLLVHSDVAKAFLPPIKTALDSAGCLLKGCERTCQIIDAEPVKPEDWDTEYLDAILSIRIVDSLEDAINHINRYGSGHTETIVAQDHLAADFFLTRVDAADVFHNCSTRFSDGFVFGLGAEVGVSTNKIHARGPVGINGLLSYKWQLKGTGQIIADYSEGRKKFTHKDL